MSRWWKVDILFKHEQWLRTSGSEGLGMQGLFTEVLIQWGWGCFLCDWKSQVATANQHKTGSIMFSHYYICISVFYNLDLSGTESINPETILNCDLFFSVNISLHLGKLYL